MPGPSWIENFCRLKSIPVGEFIVTALINRKIELSREILEFSYFTPYWGLA